MLRNCLQFRGDYWLRHLPPQVTKDFAEALVASTWDFLEHAIGDKLLVGQILAGDGSSSRCDTTGTASALAIGGRHCSTLATLPTAHHNS